MNQDRQTSQFRIFSVGTAAENLVRGSVELNVTPHEQLPYLDGELSQDYNQEKVGATDADGNAYEVEAKAAPYVTATWRSIGNSNRQTPPDVRRGEEVILYQFSDADEYYWDTLKNIVGLRKLETVVHAYSATTDEKDTEATPDNSYVFTISTHDGHITLTTSKTNKEPFAYTISLNTKDGNFKLTDDVGNHIYLDSKAKHIQLKNVSGSMFELIDKVCNLKTPESINMETKTMNVKTSTINVKGERTHEGNSLHKGHEVWQGNVNIQGGFSCVAGSGGGGSGTFQGSLRCTDEVQAGSVRLTSHRHSCPHGTTSPPF